MIIRRLSIANYKSFFDETWFDFESGFNVLLGANSTGKTSVLEAIELSTFPDMPHRSTLNIVEPGTKWLEKSRAQLCIDVKPEELRTELTGVEFLAVGMGEVLNQFGTNNLQELNEKLKRNGLNLGFKRHHGHDVTGQVKFSDWPTVWRPFNGTTSFPMSLLRLASSEFTEMTNTTASSSELNILWGSVAQRTYRFAADRRVEALSAHHSNGVLLPNCSNLAYCINWLQSTNIDLAAQLNDLLHRIFPTIYLVAAPPNHSQQFELKVHSVPSRANRGDLAVPISQVGTGVFNAVALLYVALTARTQQFLLLEEPNSFLHPRALRELLAILGEIGGLHQFFVTTHSADVLRTINASTVTLLKHDGQQSMVEQTTSRKLSSLRAGLIDVGIRLTDLHGCDRILWVEGETEEAVFPSLLRHFFPAQAEGIAVLPLHATGDFESKKINPAKVADIYRKLSHGSFLAPPMVAIALDRERKTKSAIEQIEKDCAGIVHFLPRPMLEDYLLNEVAIAYVINLSFKKQINAQQVSDALVAAKVVERNLLFPKRKNDETLHAANTLDSLFQSFGGVGAEYKKTVHGPMLAEWILKNTPNEFEELKSWLGELIGCIHAGSS